MKIVLNTTNTPNAAATVNNIGNALLPFSVASYSDGRTPMVGGGHTSSTTTPGPTASTSSISFSLKVRPHKSLSDIVHSYFRNEHAMCRNPVANCPPFSLF